VALGMVGDSLPSLGALHGLNALLLFGAAIQTALRTSGRPVAHRMAEQTARMSASS
jgi:hypothetical protein